MTIKNRVAIIFILDLLFIASAVPVSHSIHSPSTHQIHSVKDIIIHSDINLNDTPFKTNLMAVDYTPTWTYSTTSEDSMSRPVAISADGTTIVEGANNKTTIFERSSNQSLWSYDVGSEVTDVSISDDGDTIVVGTLSDLVFVFEKASGNPLWIKNCSSPVLTVSMSGNGSLIAVGVWSGRVYVFAHDSNSSIWEYQTGSIVAKVSVSEDSSTVAAVGFSRNILIFGPSTNSTLWTYHTSGLLYGLSLSSNGSIIVASSLNRVYTFNRQSNATLWTYSDYNFYNIVVSKDGSTVVAGRAVANDTNLFLWDINSNITRWTYNCSDQMRYISISSSGEKIFAGSYNHRIYLFHRNSNKTVLVFDAGTEILSVSMTSDGMALVCSDKGGHTYYFKIEPPRIVNFGSSRTYYNADESILLFASVQRGTLYLSKCVLHLSIDAVHWNDLSLTNSTPLDGSQVNFTLTIGPFKGGMISFFLSINDTLSNLDVSSTQNKLIDSKAPIISVPEFLYHPASNEDIQISVNITDEGSGVDMVTLFYSNDSLQTWHSCSWSSADPPTYKFILPSMGNGTRVKFYIVSIDRVGNTTIEDNAGGFYVLEVLDQQTSGPPSGSLETSFLLPLVGIVSIVVIISLIVLKKQNILSHISSAMTVTKVVSNIGQQKKVDYEFVADP